MQQTRPIWKKGTKKIHENKGYGATIRSKVKWFEEGEKPTQYFHNLEKQNSKGKAWESIIDSEGNTVYGTEAVLNVQRIFYEKLHTSQETNDGIAENYRKTITTKLSDEQNDILNSNITQDEILAGLKLMSNNKSPGPDGIIVELEFWRLLGEDLSMVLVNCLNNEQLTYSQYLAIIIVIYKKRHQRRSAQLETHIID